jgi:hypothetical protein
MSLRRSLPTTKLCAVRIDNYCLGLDFSRYLVYGLVLEMFRTVDGSILFFSDAA